jgi:cytochrome b6-f complex iron-sulfur subunit
MLKEESRTRTPVTRRQFLGIAWAASLAGLFFQAGWALLRFFQPRASSGAFGAFGGRVNAGDPAEFKVGSVRHILAGRFYVSHIEGAGLLALYQRCTHLGCTVPWRQDEGIFHCPCHSSLFNTAGEVLGGPAPRPLDVFAIEVVDGKVVVDTSRPIERSRFDPSQGTPV